MAKAVRRDVHKMHAFVRFRCVKHEQRERFVAWFEPEHFILQRVAPFFIDRFKSLEWAIFTPIGSLYWDREQVGGPGRRDGEAMRPRKMNSRRAGSATTKACSIQLALIRGPCAPRCQRNIGGIYRKPPLFLGSYEPPKTNQTNDRTQPDFAEEARSCQSRGRACRPCRANACRVESAHRWRAIRWLSVGSGQSSAKVRSGAAIAFVGEQPGDQEDLQGRPFVGPAGQLLRRAIAEAGIDLESRLPYECRQAFQVSATREASHPSETDIERNQPLSMVASQGVGICAPRRRGGAGCQRGLRLDRRNHYRSCDRVAPRLLARIVDILRCIPPICCASPMRKRANRVMCPSWKICAVRAI